MGVVVDQGEADRQALDPEQPRRPLGLPPIVVETGIVGIASVRPQLALGLAVEPQRREVVKVQLHQIGDDRRLVGARSFDDQFRVHRPLRIETIGVIDLFDRLFPGDFALSCET